MVKTTLKLSIVVRNVEKLWDLFETRLHLQNLNMVNSTKHGQSLLEN